MSIPCVVLKQKGAVEGSTLPLGGGKGKAAVELTADLLVTKVLKKKKTAAAAGLGILGRYSWKKKTLYVFGCVEGTSAHENQHHLPPPLEGITFYGDILVIASESKTSYAKPVSFTTADYESFYTAYMEGTEEGMYDEESEMEEEEQVIEEVIPDDELNGEGDGEIAAEEEENEEETEYNDEEDNEEEDQEVIECEDGEEDVPLAPRSPVKRRATASETKKKAAINTALPFLAKLATDPELSPESTLPSDLAEPVHPIRKAFVKGIRTVFMNNEHMKDETVLTLERLIWNVSLESCDRKKIRRSWQTIGFKDIYTSIGRRILANLSPTSYVQNTGLWKMYSNGEVSLEEIVKKNSYELYPEHWQVMIDQQAKREQIQLEGDRTRATDRFQCNRCGKKETTYYELQTRSADEPMTIFINCLNCGKRWTQ